MKFQKNIILFSNMQQKCFKICWQTGGNFAAFGSCKLFSTVKIKPSFIVISI
jgi:hypothetical protein